MYVWLSEKKWDVWYKIGYQDMSPYKHCSVAISRSENDANIFLPSKTGYWTLQLY